MVRRFLVPAVMIAIAVPVAAPAQFSESFNFIKAVRDRDGDKVQAALNKPGTVIVNTRDADTGETPLHIVIARRDALWLGFLLQRGADPNARDARGTTPLMVATRLGWSEGIETLLTYHAGVDVTGPNGETPLIRAVQNRDIASVRLLLAAGASTMKPDNAAGLSARQYAERDPRAVAILKEIVASKPLAHREIQGPR